MDKEEIREDLKKLDSYIQNPEYINIWDKLSITIGSKQFWDILSWRDKLELWFIKKYINYVNVDSIISCQDLKNGGIEIIKNKIEGNKNLWSELIINQILSEDDINKYKKDLPINELITHQKLNKNFFIKNEEKIDDKLWKLISKYQFLNIETINRFLSKLNRNELIKNQRITKELKDILCITKKDTYLLKDNLFAKLDLGKDYFLSFYSTNINYSFVNFYYPTSHFVSEGRGLFYYKDMITTNCSKNIISLRDWGTVIGHNTYKR